MNSLIKKEKKVNKKLLAIMAVGAISLMAPDIVNAAPASDLKGMAAAAETNINAIKALALSVFYMAGLFLFGGGLFLIYKDQKQPNQGHAKNGGISIIIGVLLLLIPSLIGIASTSVGGLEADSDKALRSSKGFE